MRIFPWEPRAERRARVEKARERAEEARYRAREAQAKVEQARVLQQDLRARVSDNHFFAAIREAVIGTE